METDRIPEFKPKTFGTTCKKPSTEASARASRKINMGLPIPEFNIQNMKQ
jgi:hypothetical protein